MLISILTVFVVWTGHVVAQSKDPTSLELLTNDFLTLSRITNAISLQSAYLRKSIKPRAVISELLKITPFEFSQIVNVDTVTTISTLEKLENEVNGISKSDLANKNELERMHRELHMIHGLINANFTVDPKLTPKKYSESIDYLVQHTSRFKIDCPSETAEFFGDVAEDYQDRDEDNLRDPVEDLKKFPEETSKLLTCLQSIIKMNALLQTPIFWNVHLKYEPSTAILDLRRSLDLQQVIASKLKMNLELGKEILEAIGTTGTQISNASVAYNKHLSSLVPPLSKLTIAFLSPEDLLKVPEDLKSDFFQKYFVKSEKKYRKDLEDSLSTFFRISESIQNLCGVWKQFVAFDGNILDVDEVSKKMKRLEQITNGLRIEDVEESIRILKKCDIKPENDYKSVLKEFFEQNDNSFVGDIFRQKENVEKLIGITTTVEEVANVNVYEYCLQHFLDRAKSMKMETASESQTATPIIIATLNQFKRCTGRYGPEAKSLSKFMRYYEEFDNSREAVLLDLENLEEKTTVAPVKEVTMEEVLKMTKGNEIFECLRTEKYDPSFLQKAAKFVEKLNEFPKSGDIQSTIAFFKEIEKLKTSLEPVEKLIFNGTHRLKRSSPILSLNNSGLHSENLGTCSMALLDLVNVQKNREMLSKIKAFYPPVQADMKNLGLHEYSNPTEAIKKLLDQSKSLETSAEKLRAKENLMEMSEIFEEVSELTGIKGRREKFQELIEDYETRNEFEDIADQLLFLQNNNLDFAAYHYTLKDGRFTVSVLESYFDQIFGRVKNSKTNGSETLLVEKRSWLFIIWVSCATIFLLVIGALIIYGCTRKGREKYINLYLFYFGKLEDYEKRWRYSAFADEQDGKNSLLDAVREVNKVNLLISIKKGAYINAYNNFGNTALHSAVKGVYPEMVDILIRYGADRCLLNVQNRTPEQMIPFKYREEEQEKVEKYDKIKAIFKKYRKKKFRKMIPLKFPMTSFHIYIEDRTDEELTNRFREAFESITSIEVSQSTTHIIVKTSLDGIMETDRLDLLFWIFQGAILVKETWMMQCLENRKLIEKDFDFLVERVNYRGTCYETVLEWSRAMAKSEIPFLYGVYLAVVMKEYSNMHPLSALVLCQGGVFLDEFPVKENYRIGSHPYFHAHLGPLFLIHDGTTNLDAYKNDKDKMFTLFTEEQFIRFMLKREINVDTRPNPITVSKDEP